MKLSIWILALPLFFVLAKAAKAGDELGHGSCVAICRDCQDRGLKHCPLPPRCGDSCDDVLDSGSAPEASLAPASDDELICGRSRQFCGSYCNTNAGDGDKEWNRCIRSCTGPCR